MSASIFQRYTRKCDEKYTFLLYTGQLAQAELGLDYYVARFYDPLTGHFTQADTLIPEPGKASAFDRYAYSNNNSIKYTDPSGHIGVLGGVIGASIGGMAGAIGYFSMNYRAFDSNEYWVSVAAGATSGALIGSGLAIAGATTATTSSLTTAVSTFMIGAGTSASLTEADYLISNQNSFDTTPFIIDSSISAAEGGLTAICPASRAGTALKGLVYITGSETQYALKTDRWTVDGAKYAAIEGTINAGMDVGVNHILGKTFITDSPLAEIYPENGMGKIQKDISLLEQAANYRKNKAKVDAYGGVISGMFSYRNLKRIDEDE